MRFLFIAVIVLLLDQASKFLVQSKMFEGESISILGSFFNLTYIQNPGAAFGILPDQTWIFIVITALVVAGIIIGYRYFSPSHEPVFIGLGLIVGGALGNLIDRLRVGSVIDFLDFNFWPVFNFADTAIVVGAACTVWIVWKSGEEEEKVNDDAGD